MIIVQSERVLGHEFVALYWTTRISSGFYLLIRLPRTECVLFSIIFFYLRSSHCRGIIRFIRSCLVLHVFPMQSTNPDFNKAFVRANIFKQHHEIIQVSLLSYFQSSKPDSLSQYIQPQDAHVLGQTELSHPIPMPPQLTRHFL